MPTVSLDEWLPQAKTANPDVPDDALKAYWTKEYGQEDPSTLPTLDHWMPDARKSNPSVPDYALKDYWRSEYGSRGALEKAPPPLGVPGTAWEGIKQTGRSLLAAGQAAIGDETGVVQTAQLPTKRDPALDSFYRAIDERRKQLGDDPSWLDTAGVVGGSILAQPKGAGLSIVEQAGNSLASLGTAGAGAIAGTAVAGPFGGVVGGLAGLFAGNTAVETGAKAIQAGQDGTFTPDERARVLQEGVTKGAVVSAVDVASFGASKFLTGATTRAVERATAKALTDAGVNIADHAAVTAARANPAIVEAVQTAQGAAREAASTLGKRMGRGAGALAIESLGEGVGEYLGEYAATGQADKVEAILEAVTSLGQSGAEIAAGASLNRAKRVAADSQGVLIADAKTPSDKVPDAIGLGDESISVDDAIARARAVQSEVQVSPAALDRAIAAQDGTGAPASVEASAAAPAMPVRQGPLSQEVSAYDALKRQLDVPTQGQVAAERAGLVPTPQTYDDVMGRGEPTGPQKRPSAGPAVLIGEPPQSESPAPAVLTPMELERQRLQAMREAALARARAAAVEPSIAVAPVPSKPPITIPDEPPSAIQQERQRLAGLRAKAQQIETELAGIPQPEKRASIQPTILNGPTPKPVAPPSVPATPTTQPTARIAVPPVPSRPPVQVAEPELSPVEQERQRLLAMREQSRLARGLTQSEAVQEPTAQGSSPETQKVTRPRSALPATDNAEMLLRAEKAQAELGAGLTEPRGSILDFLRQQGGVQDQGGELSAMEVDRERKPFARNLVNPDGLTLAHASELAHEAGLISERDIYALLDAIDREARGQTTAQPEWYRTLTSGKKALTQAEVETAIQKIIKDEGSDRGQAVERVKHALLGDSEFLGTPWGQDFQRVLEGDWPAWLEKPIEGKLPTAGQTDRFYEAVGPQFAKRQESSTYRTKGIPPEVGTPIASYRNNDDVKAHPDYAAAKAGDARAAIRLVNALVRPDTIEAVADRFQGAVFVAAKAKEATGVNAIPHALAAHYAESANGTVDNRIEQINKALHTGADPMERLVSRPRFQGPVTPGARYVLVDDVTTMGGTLSEMAEHIQRGGGRVLGAVTLTNTSRGGKLIPSQQRVAFIEQRFGDAVRAFFEIDPRALTDSEAGYLGNFRDADALRARAVAARERLDQRRAATSLSQRALPQLSDRSEAAPFSPEDSQSDSQFSRFDHEREGPSSQQIEQAIREGIPIAGTDQQLVDTSQEFPRELMRALSTKRYVRRLTGTLSRVFDEMQQVLSRVDPVFASASFSGLSPDSYYFGVNNRGPDTIIVNPWLSLDHVHRVMQQRAIADAELPEYLSGWLVKTLVHELTHQQVDTTHDDANQVQFARREARARAILGTRLGVMQRRIMVELTGGPDGSIAGLRDDLDAQRTYWQGRTGVRPVDQSVDAEPADAGRRQSVSGEGARGRTGPTADLRDGSRDASGTLDAGTQLPGADADGLGSAMQHTEKDARGDPSESESRAVQSGIEGKSVLEAARFLATSAPSEDYRLIASRVATQIDRLERAGMRFDLRVSHLGDQVPSRLVRSRGLTFRAFNSPLTTVYIQGSDVTGFVGASYETVLHELIHAATQTALYVANQKTSVGNPLASLSRDVFAVSNAIVKHFNDRVRSGATLTDFERTIFDGRNNALESPDEVIAWALSSRAMQAYLDTIPYRGQTLWTRFVESIRNFLGLPARADTALSEILRLAERALETPVNELMAQAKVLHLPTATNQTDGLSNQHRTQSASRSIVPITPGTPPVVQGAPQPPSFQVDDPSRLDGFIRQFQDQFIDVRKTLDAVKATGKEIADEVNPVLAEELYQGRAATMTNQFLKQELEPLLRDMYLSKITLPNLDTYLHARHAEEANAALKAINPDRTDNDALSGMTNKEAKDILDAAPPAMARLAKKVDAMIAGTRHMLVDYGLESAETVNAWREQYQHYIPLMREGFEEDGQGTGAGRSVTSSGVKTRLGSTRGVVHVLANIALQRERTIARGEKQKPVIALAGLLMLNPNKDLASLTKATDVTYTNPATGLPETTLGAIGDYTFPTIRYKDPRTGNVVSRPDPMARARDNVVSFRLQGKTYAIVFNEDSARGMAMAASLKALDTVQLNVLARIAAPITRYYSSINTQFNPFFGVKNFIRDAGFASLSLSSTPLAGQQGKVLRYAATAMKSVYLQARAERAGKTYHSPDTKWWERFKEVGGQTGFRDLYTGAQDRAQALEHALDSAWWQKTKLGRLATLGGVLAKPEQFILDAKYGGKALFNWLSDYNQAMENAIRVSVFKAGVEQGMSDKQAASIAKNITVNFNKKGSLTTQLGALYGFFNASVQGTARLAETLLTQKDGTIRLSQAGKRIVQGGLLFGAMQAMLLAAAGFDDEEPPEFVRERNVVIPMPGTAKGYAQIPMPLGFHMIPMLSRLAVEAVIYGHPGKKAWQFVSALSETFSPVGGAGSVAQLLSPSALDPMTALIENKDWTGKPIYREDFSKLHPTPGTARAKDTSTWYARAIAEVVNYATGGTAYVPGAVSPTPDAIDYLIGQVTGGVGREVGKAVQVGQSLTTGEVLPTHKIPLLGTFYGQASSDSATRAKFYRNLERLSEYKAEIDGRIKDHGDVAGYMRSTPEAALAEYAHLTERAVSKLTKTKRDLLKQSAPKAQIEQIESRITAQMQRLNQRVEQVQR